MLTFGVFLTVLRDQIQNEVTYHDMVKNAVRCRQTKNNMLQWQEVPLVLINERQFSYINDGREFSLTSYANY